MSPRSRRWSAAGSVVTALALLAGLSPTATAAPAPTTAPGAPAASVVPRIAWGSCGSAKLAAFQCATARVPLDYDRPRGATVTIALTRLPATQPAAKIGSVFVNPGGPGGSGVDAVQEFGPIFPAPVRARFDIVGFDPRGVVRSDPATCFRTAAAELAFLQRSLIFPRTAAEERRFVAESKTLGRTCAAISERRFDHISTANVARDLDLLRRAVGDSKLTYVGLSYGTYLGATYAKLFPGKVRALVLDGTLDPREYSGTRESGLPTATRADQGQGGAEVFAEFLRRCKAAGPQRCSLAAVGEPRVVARRVLDGLKRTPVVVPLPDGTRVTLTYQVMVAQTFSALYDPTSWAELADVYAGLALQQSARAGGGLAALRPGKEEYPSLGGSIGSTCVDGPTPPTRTYPRTADRQDARYPDFGRYRAWIDLPCRYLKAAGVRDGDAYRGPWKQTTKAQVLVLGTRWDPATPYANTRPYARLFPKAAVVTLNGWGHVATLQSSCALGTASAYLLDPTQRRRDTTCAAEIVPFVTPSAATQRRAAQERVRPLPLLR